MEDSRRFHLHSGQYGTAIAVRVTPRSSQQGVCGIMEDGTIKIRLHAQESAEEVNRALLQYLSEILGVSQSKMEIVAGKHCAEKLVAILDIDANTIQRKITQNLR
ncbi:MAG: DUF167 domain-containing protein [Anaerolineae bacterium]|nr:DUF167 domain-containing protein [Anaerolineae bacterium]